MEVRISYALSVETKPEYEAALSKKAASQAKGGKVKDVEIQQVGDGQFVGVIVMEETA